MNIKSMLTKVRKHYKISTASLLIAITAIASFVFTNSFAKNVVIQDGSNLINTTSIYSEVNSILKQAGIELKNNDLVEVNSDKTEIRIKRAFEVYLNRDNTNETFYIAEGTVKDLLTLAKIDLTDEYIAEPGLDTELTKGMTITIAKAINVNVKLNGSVNTLKIAQGSSVADVLKKLNIENNESILVSPSLETIVSPETLVEISNIEYKERTEIQPIAFSQVQKNTDSLYVGESKIEVQGISGQKEIVIKDKMINGQNIETTVKSETIIKKPVTQVRLIGSKPKENKPKNSSVSVNVNNKTITDCSGKQINYSKVITGTCTAYNEKDGSKTSTGKSVKVGYVAVDPKIIPYGTKLYICSPDGKIVYGYAEAADTGGAMLSGRVLADLFYNSERECQNFGRRKMNLYVVS